MVIDVDFGESVVEPVDVVAGHQGQGVDPGVPGRFGVTFVVGPPSASQEPSDDVNEKQGCGSDEEDGPVRKVVAVSRVFKQGFYKLSWFMFQRFRSEEP